jgi:hypothetical protein
MSRELHLYHYTYIRTSLGHLDVSDRALNLRKKHSVSLIMWHGNTLFGFFQVIGPFVGAEIGFLIGKSQLGLTAGIISGILGFPIGYVAGTAPLWLTWYLSDYLGIQKAKTEVLRAKVKSVLKGGSYFQTASWIAELVLRGDLVESYWPDALSLLKSEGRRNSYGERMLRMGKPQHLVSQNRETDS